MTSHDDAYLRERKRTDHCQQTAALAAMYNPPPLYMYVWIEPRPCSMRAQKSRKLAPTYALL